MARSHSSNISLEDITKIHKDIENQKDLLVSSANVVYQESVANIRMYGTNDYSLLMKKLDWQLQTLVALNEYFKLRWQNSYENDAISSSSESRDSKSQAPVQPPPFPVQLKSHRVMRVSCFNSIQDFWLQLSSGQVKKDALSTLLNDKLKSELLLEATDITAGQTVIVRTTFGVIRARVLKKYKRGRLQVLDLDSGNEASTTSTAYEPDEETLATHQQAVHCKLSKNDGLFYADDHDVRRSLCSGDLTVTFVETVPDKYVTYSVLVNSKPSSSNVGSFHMNTERLAFDKKTLARQNKQAFGDKEFPVLIKEPQNNTPVNYSEMSPKHSNLNGFHIMDEEKQTTIVPSYSPKPIIKIEKVIKQTSKNEVRQIPIPEISMDPSTTERDMSISTLSSTAFKSVFKEGEEYIVMISHIVSPDEMYANIINKETALMESLEKKMREVYEDPSRPILSVCTGDAVACLSDNLWVRGVVKTMQCSETEEDHLVVYLTDFGDTIRISASQCADLLPKFQSLPALAHRFSLAKICPAFPSTRWSSHVKSELKNILDPDKVMKLNIVTEANDQCDCPSAVLSFIDCRGGERVVNTMLIDKGLASSNYSAAELYEAAFQPKTQDEIEEEELDKWNPMEEDYLYGNDYDDENVNCAVTGYDPQDEKNICHLFFKTGKCDRLGCRREHKVLNPDGWTTDKEPVYIQAYNELKLPAPGSKCTFYLTEAKCISEMFGILSHENLSSSKNPDGHGNVHELVENINSREELRKATPLKVLPSLGQIVLAKCKAHGDLFYRARVLEVADNSHDPSVAIKIVYVDYGTVDWIELRMLRNIQPKFLHLPFLSVEVLVIDLAAKDEYLQEARRVFMDLANKEEITADVVSVQMGNNQLWRLYVRDIRFGDKYLSRILGRKAHNPGRQQTLLPSNDALHLPG